MQFQFEISIHCLCAFWLLSDSHLVLSQAHKCRLELTRLFVRLSCHKYNSGRLAVGKYTELLATRARNELLKYYRMYLEYSTKVPKYIKVS